MVNTAGNWEQESDTATEEHNVENVQMYARDTDKEPHADGAAKDRLVADWDGKERMCFGRVYDCRSEGTDRVCECSSRVEEVALDVGCCLKLGVGVETALRLVCIADLPYRQGHPTAETEMMWSVSSQAEGEGLLVSQTSVQVEAAVFVEAVYLVKVQCLLAATIVVEEAQLAEMSYDSPVVRAVAEEGTACHSPSSQSEKKAAVRLQVARKEDKMAVEALAEMWQPREVTVAVQLQHYL